VTFTIKTNVVLAEKNNGTMHPCPRSHKGSPMYVTCVVGYVKAVI